MADGCLTWEFPTFVMYFVLPPNNVSPCSNCEIIVAIGVGGGTYNLIASPQTFAGRNWLANAGLSATQTNGVLAKIDQTSGQSTHILFASNFLVFVTVRRILWYFYVVHIRAR